MNEQNFGSGLATRLTCIPLPATNFEMMERESTVDYESDERLKSWAEKLDKTKGILPLDKIVDALLCDEQHQRGPLKGFPTDEGRTGGEIGRVCGERHHQGQVQEDGKGGSVDTTRSHYDTMTLLHCFIFFMGN